ncbi:MAG: dTMP kinase [Nanohaloarchaea archaeon]|nr:dTMP kinase [Candidatus Nanohaloarchaea archaeon]
MGSKPSVPKIGFMKERELPGKFIVVEGADGAGTTTMSKKLAEEVDAYWTREPAENSIGQKVDEMISGDKHSAEAISLAFAADRMIHLEEEVIPRLEKGKTVVSDRYYHSSLVYQPAMGVDFEWKKQLNREAIKPDLTVLIDVEAETGMARVEERGKDGNIFEEMDFQQEVVMRYRQLPEKLEEQIVKVDGSKGIQEVAQRVKNAVRGHIDG